MLRSPWLISIYIVGTSTSSVPYNFKPGAPSYPSCPSRGLLSRNAPVFVPTNSAVKSEWNVNYIIHNRGDVRSSGIFFYIDWVYSNWHAIEKIIIIFDHLQGLKSCEYTIKSVKTIDQHGRSGWMMNLDDWKFSRLKSPRWFAKFDGTRGVASSRVPLKNRGPVHFLPPDDRAI